MDAIVHMVITVRTLFTLIDDNLKGIFFLLEIQIKKFQRINGIFCFVRKIENRLPKMEWKKNIFKLKIK